MFVRLGEYGLGKRYMSFAADDEGERRLLESGLDFLRLTGNIARHYPSGEQFVVDEKSRINLLTCGNFDVFDIDPEGQAFLCYNNRSSDNVVFVAGRCNSACLMCPDSDAFRSKAPMRDINELLELVRYIPSDTPHLTVTGGEPFMLGWDIFTLFKALDRKFCNTEFLLLTNGRILSISSYCVETAKTLPRFTTIGIPVHGYDAESHDRITRVKGSFAQTVRGIKHLLDLGLRVELRVVVSKLSCDYLSRLADFIVRELKGVHCVKIIGLEMLGNAAINRELIWLPYKEAFEKSKVAIVKLMNGGIDVGLYNFPLCSVDEHFWTICEKSISDYKVRFAEECASCYVKDACGGVFAGTRRLAVGDLKAIERRSR